MCLTGLVHLEAGVVVALTLGEACPVEENLRTQAGTAPLAGVLLRLREAGAGLPVVLAGGVELAQCMERAGAALAIVPRFAQGQARLVLRLRAVEVLLQIGEAALLEVEVGLEGRVGRGLQEGRRRGKVGVRGRKPLAVGEHGP